MALRQARTLRHRGLQVCLQERDRYVLEVLGRFRLARTRDLLLTCFPGINPTTGTIRLRRLFDAGYLAVHSGLVGHQNVYTLGRKALEWKLGPIPKGHLEHHLEIVHTWATLSQSPPGVELELARPDWELRQQAPPIPDLFAVFKKRGFAFEIDRGTESRPTLRKKLAGYGTHLYGYQCSVILVGQRSHAGTHSWDPNRGAPSLWSLLQRLL